MLSRRRLSLLALITFSLSTLSVVTAATADERLDFNGLVWPPTPGPTRLISYELRADAAGRAYIASAIDQGSQKAGITITPESIVFDDGYSIDRNAGTESPEISMQALRSGGHVQTLTAFSPGHEKSATMQVQVKGLMVEVTGRREVARLLRNSASFRLFAGRVSGEGSWPVITATGTNYETVLRGSYFLTTVVHLITGGTDSAAPTGESFVLSGLRFSQVFPRK